MENISHHWNKSSITKRKQLIKALGYKKGEDFAELDYSDLKKHSGGMIQRDLDKLWNTYKKRKKKL